MINEVRNTVLSILNKNNYGYISPSDFNLFAKQAQLDMFEQYFYDYNRQINLENNRLGRLSGSGLANLKKQLLEVIDTFTQYIELTVSTSPQTSTQTFDLPNDWYTIVEVIWGQDCVEGTDYSNKEAERVNEPQIRRLLRSNLTAPSPQFPAYIITQQGYPIAEGPGSGAPPVGTYGNLSNQITLYPRPEDTCTLSCGLTYVRYPKDPKWTYQNLTGGQPVFDQSQADFQDFELPLSDFDELITRILKYSGMSIREQEIVTEANATELKNNQTEQ